MIGDEHVDLSDTRSPEPDLDARVTHYNYGTEDKRIEDVASG